MRTIAKQVAGVALALGFVTAAGAWQGPISDPPQGNVAAPLNVGPSAQSKQGTVGVGGLGVFGRAFVSATSGYTIPSNLQLGVNGAVGADAYCDASGQNCVTSLGEAATSTAPNAGIARAWVTYRNIGGTVNVVGESEGVSSLANGAAVPNFLYYDTIVTFSQPLLASSYAVVVSPSFNSGSGFYEGSILDWVCVWSKVSASSVGVHCGYPGHGAYGNSIVSVTVFAS